MLICDMHKLIYVQICLCSACFLFLAEGCGVGEGVSVQTLEAAPEGLPPPTVKAAGANVLEVHWSPPQKPNGVITSYHIYR